MENLRVKTVNPKTDALFELVLERGAVTFEPGNCLALFSDETESRPYSISSGTDEDVRGAQLRTGCLQVGGGAVPAATAEFLDVRKDLGIHTELFTDWMIDLIEKGCIILYVY